jgi:polysaccharide deacetylase family protein (PEP-CTERM system associated)
MTIDVEDWFHVENLRPVISRESWNERELRVEASTDRLLELLARHDTRGTCFVLGWVAERCPGLVRRIASAGHEIASHGYGHDLLPRLGPVDFREDLRRSKAILEDLGGQEVRGYRAPSFSITAWAIPILRDLGFSYDSSLFPTRGNSRYGRLAGAGSGVTELEPGLREVPIGVLAAAGVSLPWGGGGYFRLAPYRAFRLGIRRVLRTGRPYVFYLHPWEIDPGQPRVEGIGALSRFRHYTGLDTAEVRFERLLKDFRWQSVADLLAGAG